MPLGAFLSGGVDSSTLVALMQSLKNENVKTFTIGFNEYNYDESNHAEAVANHLGTEHNKLLVTDADARDVIPDLPQLYDEPFADSSQIPTYLICRSARKKLLWLYQVMVEMNYLVDITVMFMVQKYGGIYRIYLHL